MQNHGILAKNMAFWQNHGIRFSCFCDFLLFLPVDNVYLSLRSLCMATPTTSIVVPRTSVC